MKKNIKKFRNFETDEDYDAGYHERLIEHRREKRMKNAMRCRNINDLIDEDDY